MILSAVPTLLTILFLYAAVIISNSLKKAVPLTAYEARIVEKNRDKAQRYLWIAVSTFIFFTLYNDIYNVALYLWAPKTSCTDVTGSHFVN